MSQLKTNEHSPYWWTSLGCLSSTFESAGELRKFKERVNFLPGTQAISSRWTIFCYGVYQAFLRDLHRLSVWHLRTLCTAPSCSKWLLHRCRIVTPRCFQSHWTTCKCLFCPGKTNCRRRPRGTAKLSWPSYKGCQPVLKINSVSASRFITVLTVEKQLLKKPAEILYSS